MGKKSRDKGKRGELEARDMVRSLWDCPDCVRAAQVSGQFSADLMGGPDGLHLEVKRYKRIVSNDYLVQAIEDAAEGDLPVVLAREDSGDWSLTLRMEDAYDFADRLLAHRRRVGRDADRVSDLRREPRPRDEEGRL